MKKDFEPANILEHDEQILLQCSKPELTEKTSVMGYFIGLGKTSQVRDQADYYGRDGKVKADLLHVDSDILLVTDKRFLMFLKGTGLPHTGLTIGGYGIGSWRTNRNASTRHTTISDFELYLDKTYAMKTAQEMQVKNEEAVDKAHEKLKESSGLKKYGYMWGIGRKEVRSETYGYRPIPPILVEVEKVKHMLGKEELELKFIPVPVVRGKQYENPEWANKLANFLLKFPMVSKGVYSLKFKEKDKIDELFQILKQKADENKDLAQNEADSQ